MLASCACGDWLKPHLLEDLSRTSSICSSWATPFCSMVPADFIIVSLVMSISKFLKMHQKTIRVQLHEGPHFVLFIRLLACTHVRNMWWSLKMAGQEDIYRILYTFIFTNFANFAQSQKCCHATPFMLSKWIICKNFSQNNWNCHFCEILAT